MAQEWPREITAELNAFFGNPDSNVDGEPDPAWESANLVKIAAPWPMVAAWDVSKPISGLRVHWKVAASLQAVFARIRAAYNEDEAAIRAARLHLYGGAYNFRLKRTAPGLSIHAYGAAIDLDPERNPLGKKWKPNAGMMPEQAVEAFRSEGWTWGGDWKTGDAMHFQAVR